MVDVIVPHAHAGAHGRATIAGDIPGEPDARIPFIEVGLDTRLSSEGWVPG